MNYGPLTTNIAPLPLEGETTHPNNSSNNLNSSNNQIAKANLQRRNSSSNASFSYRRDVHALSKPPLSLVQRFKNRMSRLSASFKVLTPTYWLLNISHALAVAWLHSFMAFNADVLVQTFGLSASEAGYASATVTGGVVFILPLISGALDKSGRALQAASVAAILGAVICFYIASIAGVPGSLTKKAKDTPKEVLEALAISTATPMGYVTVVILMAIMAIVEATTPSVLLGRLAYPDCVTDSDYLGLAYALAVWVGAPLNAAMSMIFGSVVHRMHSYRIGFLVLGGSSIIVLCLNVICIFTSDRLTWTMREKAAVTADALQTERDQVKQEGERRRQGRQIALVVKAKNQTKEEKQVNENSHFVFEVQNELTNPLISK
eukprot:GDKJ01020293.1.p1 GENE.GDKJ01020293.1~~GDKJ01020293.1.p1  ORF type:complete len:377 (+),score=86.03 GDKJ01020293.1:796-1926(+)